jgi:peptidoglycan/LPS O-acetylase OafA/YrhL
VENTAHHRPDIDGLRAVAVSALLVFAAFPQFLPGGFLGIDVVFVLSGFLISSTVLSGLDRGAFSLRDFYGRRIRRGLPALLPVLAVSLMLGWFMLFADEYRALGREAAGGAGFVANFVQWRDGSYFDRAAATRILLNLWPLAIVAQFYLVWPPLLALASRYKRGPAILVFVAFALSFAVNLWLIRHAGATAAFYSPLSRAWELMAGAALALLKRRGWEIHPGNADAAASAGLLLLVASFVFNGNVTAFPWAVLPVLGTFLLIGAGPEAWPNRRMLGGWAIAPIGLVSYPLYLWHWPLLAFARIYTSVTPSPTGRVAVLALSLLLAIATHRWIERRTARPLFLVTLLAVVGTLGLVCYAANGVPGTGFRSGPRQAFVDHFDRQDVAEIVRLECDFYKGTTAPRPVIATACTERDPSKRHAVLLWGDSHAQQLYWGLKQTLPPDWQILQVASTRCFPDPDVRGPSTTDYCRQSNWTALQTVAKARPDVVVVAQEGGQRTRRFAEISARIQPLGIARTLFAGPAPHWMTRLPNLVARRLWPAPPRRTFIGLDPGIRNLNDSLERTFETTDAMAFVDIMGALCDSHGCLTYVGDDVMDGLTSPDDAHLSPKASAFVARELLARMVTGSVRR